MAFDIFNVISNTCTINIQEESILRLIDYFAVCVENTLLFLNY